DIVDRHGKTLASSVQRYKLWVNQMQVEQYLQNSGSAEETGVPAAAAELSPVRGWSVRDTDVALTGDRGSVYLLNNVQPAVRDDGAALAGTELSFDDTLRGTDGKTQYERGAGGQIIPTGKRETTDAVDGSDLVLTIDRDLQWKAQQIVAGAVEDVGGSGGSAVA